MRGAHWPLRCFLLGGLILVGSRMVWAGTGGGGDFPWDPLLDNLVANIGGRTLRNILILAIIGAGVGFYFSERGGWMHTAFAIIVGFSIACAAATWGPSFFGLASAAVPGGTPRPPLTVWDGVWTAGRIGGWWVLMHGLGTVLWDDLAPLVRDWGSRTVRRAG